MVRHSAEASESGQKQEQEKIIGQDRGISYRGGANNIVMIRYSGVPLFP